MAPKRAPTQRTIASQINSIQERNARDSERRAPVREEVRHMTRALFEAEAAREQEDAARAQGFAGDAYDNEAFLAQYSGLDPLYHNWNDTLDSDATLPPSQPASPQPQPQPQATTTAAPQDAGMCLDKTVF